MARASALWRLSLPFLLSHSPSYKLLMSHNLCMAMIRFNEVPTTLGWLSSAAARSLICDRAQLSLGRNDRSNMQTNLGFTAPSPSSLLHSQGWSEMLERNTFLFTFCHEMLLLQTKLSIQLAGRRGWSCVVLWRKKQCSKDTPEDLPDVKIIHSRFIV